MPVELFWEDFAPGQGFELGERTVTAEEIVAFAERWDPQPFHLDAEAAREGPFGALAASGWHSASLWMRLYVDAVLLRAASMGSPGLEELRWLAPVYAGDTVRARFTVEDVQPSSRRPDRGTVFFGGELVNQRDETVLRMRGRGYFSRREPSRAPG